MPTPILAPEPTQESAPETTFETTQNSTDSGVSFFEKVSDCVGSLWNSAKNNVNTWRKNKKKNDLRELYEGAQLDKNLTKQCKTINSAGTVVYNCGIFGDGICCRYRDTNGIMKYDLLKKGSPVKKYTTIGLGSATVIVLGLVGWKLLTLK